MRIKAGAKERSRRGRSFAVSNQKKEKLFQLHPLFIVIGVWYCIKGELFLFLLSALVALQHECAHAFAAAKLGYKLRKIVLMPYGAVIDGDLRGISFKDEIFVALCGPLCNLCIAALFVAIWWLHPTVYAFTDTACYSSLAIGLINFLPAYPLDGGRILKCALIRAFLKTQPQERRAREKAEKICRAVTFFFAALCLSVFALFCYQKTFQFSLLAFGLFLLVGAFGSPDKDAVYEKMDFSFVNALKNGVEIRRVAILDTCPIKDALFYVCRGYYLVLEVYDKNENFCFLLPQNLLNELFALAPNPYASLKDAYALYVENGGISHENRHFFAKTA